MDENYLKRNLMQFISMSSEITATNPAVACGAASR
jgi:hypothetical protein